MACSMPWTRPSPCVGRPRLQTSSGGRASSRCWSRPWTRPAPGRPRGDRARRGGDRQDAHGRRVRARGGGARTRPCCGARATRAAITYPYGPWAQALGRSSTACRGSGRERARPDAAALAQMLPPDRLAAAPALPPDQGRLRLYEAVVRCLDAIERLPVLVLDDLQWADADSLDLLVHVARFAAAPADRRAAPRRRARRRRPRRAAAGRDRAPARAASTCCSPACR